MLKLRTFGSLSVERDGKPLTAASASRRRIALLPLLGAEGERGMGRDKVLAYLWPESEEERARNALAQTLHALRRDLGEDELFLTGRELRLNPEVISSDAGEFALALKHGDFERAASLYEGPFLEGFHLSVAHEFESWVADARERFAAQAKHAAASADLVIAVSAFTAVLAIFLVTMRKAISVMITNAAPSTLVNAAAARAIDAMILPSR